MSTETIEIRHLSLRTNSVDATAQIDVAVYHSVTRQPDFWGMQQIIHVMY